jgi:hypothetical protein
MHECRGSGCSRCGRYAPIHGRSGADDTPGRKWTALTRARRSPPSTEPASCRYTAGSTCQKPLQQRIAVHGVWVCAAPGYVPPGARAADAAVAEPGKLGLDAHRASWLAAVTRRSAASLTLCPSSSSARVHHQRRIWIPWSSLRVVGEYQIETNSSMDAASVARMVSSTRPRSSALIERNAARWP